MPDREELAIEARGLGKAFRIPAETGRDGAAGMVRGVFRKRPHSELQVLDNVTFEVRRGEFFGVCGRNGSGKSTLLKILAGIYGADRGTVRVAGRVAPIIDLGVGFHPELTARDNVEVNGVMLGLQPQQARDRFHEIMAMAELEEFAGLKLKNYSTGMRVRLAFSVIAQVDADLLLIDEVLAVGDDAFQRTCERVFRRFTESGKTIVFVTHQMQRIERLCDRAMLLEAGSIDRIGSPGDVARRYVEVNLEHGAIHVAGADEDSGDGAGGARIADLWIEDPSGQRVLALRQGDEIKLRAVVEALEDLSDSRFRFEIRSHKRGRIFASPARRLSQPDTKLTAGERVHIEATVENRLAPGGYVITCAVSRTQEGDRVRASEARTAEFAVVGTDSFRGGVVALHHDVRVKRLSERPSAGRRQVDGVPP